MIYPLITQDSKSDAVILAAGDYPTHIVPTEILRTADYVCCCDSATVSYIRKNHKPDAIVCDGDSLPIELQQKYADILHIEKEQDYNDLTKATRFCMAKGFKNIFYLGATGKREDHTLGNISLMISYMCDFDIRPVMVTNYGYFVPAQGRNVFETFKRQQFSVFNVSGNTIKEKGLVWDTSAVKYMWQGTLNEAIGDEVELDTDGLYMVYRTFGAK